MATLNTPLPAEFFYTRTGTIRKNTPGSKHRYSWRACGRCGVQFLGAYHATRKGWSKFCSKSCARSGGVYVDEAGYRVVRGRREHLLVAERVLGRSLKKGEVVHHVNMNKLDNRPENLVVCTAAYHQFLHARYQQLFVEKFLS